MIDNDINFHLIYYLSSPPHTVRTSGKCSYALLFCRMGTPPVHIACSLRKWIHAGDLLFWLGRCCWCANSPCQSRKCSTHSGLCITSFCLVCLVQVVVARLLVRMALIDWLQRKALVCLCCHVLFHSGSSAIVAISNSVARSSSASSSGAPSSKLLFWDVVPQLIMG